MLQFFPRKRLGLSPSVCRLLRPLDFRPDRYSGPIAQIVHRLTLAADRREIAVDRLLDELQSAFDETNIAAEFARWADAWPSGDEVERWLCRRLPLGRNQAPNMRLQLFYLKPHCSEPPHYHNKMASLQCVVRGHVICRQYDRVARTDENVLMIRPVSQRKLAAGQTFRMTDHKNNVHWFGTEDEPAVILDFFIEGRGLYETSFEPDPKQPLRRYYLDPTGIPDADNLIATRELSTEEAYGRFAAKSIISFEWHN